MTNKQKLLDKLAELRKEIPSLLWEPIFDYSVSEKPFIVGIYRVGIVDIEQPTIEIKAKIKSSLSELLDE